MGAWLAKHGADLLQNGAIVASFLLSFAGYRLNVSVLREDQNGRRVSNLITLTQQHREIWRDSLRPGLARLRDPLADLLAHPISREEEAFVKDVILHFATSFQAIRHGEVASFGNVSADAGAFFSLPIPRAVWARVKFAQDEEFVGFVEEALRAAS
jgi:hypothetical protein